MLACRLGISLVSFLFCLRGFGSRMMCGVREGSLWVHACVSVPGSRKKDREEGKYPFGCSWLFEDLSLSFHY